MIAHNPLHGSGRAALPHPARALGDDAHAALGLTRLNTRPARSPRGRCGSLIHFRVTFPFTTTSPV